MISKELEVKIVTQARGGLKPGTIASNFGIHPDTVKRALEKPHYEASERRASVIDPWIKIIDSLLESHPKIRATRIRDLLRERGYNGSVYPIRRYCKEVRSHSHKAYLDLNFLPGEAAQVDWAYFGRIKIGKATRKLYVLIVVLAYSRRIYARYFLEMSQAQVMEGHMRAFEVFAGVPRKILYDNMKTAVLEHVGIGVRFNPGMLDFAKHYAFEPIACNLQSGWEKGRVERTVRYLRESFFEARSFEGVEDLNRQLEEWLDGAPMERRWIEDYAITVRDAFEQEKLSPLPGVDFDA